MPTVVSHPLLGGGFQVQAVASRQHSGSAQDEVSRQLSGLPAGEGSRQHSGPAQDEGSRQLSGLPAGEEFRQLALASHPPQALPQKVMAPAWTVEEDAGRWVTAVECRGARRRRCCLRRHHGRHHGHPSLHRTGADNEG